MFYFNEVIYYIHPCIIDNRWCNIVFTTNGSSKHTYNKHFSLNKSYREFERSIQDGRVVIDSEGLVHIFNLLCVKMEINSHWQ